jgi:hypothetical protein
MKDDVPVDDNFGKVVFEFRKTFPDLFSSRAFYSIYEALKEKNEAYRPSPGEPHRLRFKLPDFGARGQIYP